MGHIGKLLQAYREAAPDQREEALLAAMREIRKGSIPAGAIPAATGKASNSTAKSSGGTAAATATAVEPRQERTAAPVKIAQPEEAMAAVPASARPPFVPDLFTPSFGQDRRTFPRLRCFIAVELRSEGWDAPVWGNLANVSAGGCFIETMEPVRKSTKLEVGLWANNGKVWVKGIVINGVVTENNPTFGVRLRYTNMDANERDTLRFFLKFVEDTTKNYEKQNGYLAQLKR